MNSVITGGAGFIGSHLARKLREGGHSVTVLDLVQPGSRVPGVQYLRVDTRDPHSLGPALETADVIYHFAAIVSVPECELAPFESYRTNLLGTANIVDYALKSGRRPRIVLASSSAVYGNLGNRGLPLSETLELGEPLSLYGAQKLGSEHLLRIAHRHHGLPAVCLRFFNVYGPGQSNHSPYSGVITRFRARLEGNQSLEIHGTGSQTRDFVWVEDVAEACQLAATASPDVCKGTPFNVGSGLSVSVRDLALRMKQVWGGASILESLSARAGDVRDSNADISLIRQALGWSPKVSLEQGLSFLRQSAAARHKAA